MTWAELTTQVFYNLDLPSVTTGDVKAAVEAKLQDVLVSISNLYDLRELFRTSDAFTLEEDTDAVPLGATGFEVTDLSEIAWIGIDFEGEGNDELIQEYSWITWKKLYNTMSGDQREEYRWTIDPEDNFYFSTLPSGTDTWDAYLHYYKTVAPFVSTNEPELAERHQRVLVLGATTYFPQQFTGARESLFLKFQNEYNVTLREIQNKNRAVMATTRMKHRVLNQRYGRIRWE